MNAQLLRTAARLLRDARTVLSSPHGLTALRETAATIEAAEVVEHILGLAGFLDDSVSNDALGSIFNRTDRSPVNEMLAQIAGAYGVPVSIAGTTGTSGLNVPAVMALAGEGQQIGVVRDCHVSITEGLCRSGAEPNYLEAPFDPEACVLLPPTPSEVAAFLDSHPGIVAFVITVPTYHGLMGDIAGIVAECHQRGVLVMADAAHGPHFAFLNRLGFPLAAEHAGADIVTQSTHKVMSALNQGFLVHFNNESLVHRYEVFQAGSQSTSFSYLILLSIEYAVEQMVNHGVSLWRGTLRRAARLREEAARFAGVGVLDEQIIDGRRVVGMDLSRVTVNVRETGLSGYAISSGLPDRRLISELASPDVVLFLVSPGTTEGVVDDTIDALRAMLRQGSSPLGCRQTFAPPPLPPRVLTPRQAVLSDSVRVPVGEAVGRVCAETIGAYPPGQPIFVAGERITAEGVEYLGCVVQAGGHLKRVADDGFRTIEVVQEL